MNRNFDLDIKNYVSVDFAALVEVIDLLGGVDIDMTSEEVKYCNQYAYETAIVSEKPCEDLEIWDGVQHVDGCTRSPTPGSGIRRAMISSGRSARERCCRS